MSGFRRFSQAISEGDGISLLVPVRGPDEARAAGEQGAEGVVVHGTLAGVRDATDLPILWRAEGPVEHALDAGADAFLLVAQDVEDDSDALAELHSRALEHGLDCVVQVENDDDLELVLEQFDPEIFLLSPREESEEEALEHVLDLLPSVPAGKLAIADVAVSSREQVVALERAGIDAVIVGSGDVTALVGELPPEV
jgi:indole-3-glycerol phosphate synthase